MPKIPTNFIGWWSDTPKNSETLLTKACIISSVTKPDTIRGHTQNNTIGTPAKNNALNFGGIPYARPLKKNARKRTNKLNTNEMSIDHIIFSKVNKGLFQKYIAENSPINFPYWL